MDVAQLLAFYSHSFTKLYNEKAVLDQTWLSTEVSLVPWASLMVVGLNHMNLAASREDWKQKDLLDLGKFLVLLFPPQLEEIPTSEFKLGSFPQLLSPQLTHCQRTVLYRKYLSTSKESVPELLLAAVPSSTLLRIGSTSSPLPLSLPQDLPALLAASALMVPSQMLALHTLTRPSLWQADTLAAILASHPPCLADVTPQEFRANIQVT